MEIKIPRLGMSMTEGILSSWLVENGKEVTEGMPLYSLESDKAVQEIESPASGVLTIAGVEGETYEVGAVIGQID